MSNLTGSVNVVREREQERRARLQLLDNIERERSPQPIFGEPVKVDLEDEISRRIKNTLGDFTQVLENDSKNLIGISRSSSSGHMSNGLPSNGFSTLGHVVNGYTMSSGSHPVPGHLMPSHASSSGYPPNVHLMASYGLSGSSVMGHSSLLYGKTQAIKKPPIVNGAIVPKPLLPNYTSPKAPDKKQNLIRTDKVNYSNEKSMIASTQQAPFHLPDSRPKESIAGDKDLKRSNMPQVSAESATVSNLGAHNAMSTSASIWNCGPDTPAIQINPFHLPACATPSVPVKSSYGQTSSSNMPLMKDSPTSIPAKRILLRPSSLKFPEKKSVDPPCEVETILKEMTKAVPPAPLTAIQTPRTEETGFNFPTDPKHEMEPWRLDKQVQLITPLDDPMPNETRQPSQNPLWKPTPQVVLPSNVAVASVPQKSETAAPVSEPAPPASNSDVNKYVSSLQDDLEMSDSDEEVVPETKPAVEVLKSPENNATTMNNTTSDTNPSAESNNSAESSNSSSDSDDSDSDDSSSESNDSDSSSEASGEEISSKKWGLSNFVDESQRIHSPAFFSNDARLQAERNKSLGIGSVNNVFGASKDNSASSNVGNATPFLVPDVPPAKSEILSPIPSPVHATIGPRTPPSPSLPLKQEIKEEASSVGESAPPGIKAEPLLQENSPQSELLAQTSTIDSKSNVQAEKGRKLLRSGKLRTEEFSPKVEISHEINLICDERSDSKEQLDIKLEKEESPTKGHTDNESTVKIEFAPENYSIKTRQSVSLVKKTKTTVDEEIKSKDDTEVIGIAKLKHPRACRANAKQTKKVAANASAKLEQSEPKNKGKLDQRESNSGKGKDTEKAGITKPAQRGAPKCKSKLAKTPPKPVVDTKKVNVKRRKRFSVENFVQSSETESGKSNPLTTFSPSPVRSPIPECTAASSDAVTTAPAKKGATNYWKKTAAKKVEKLRRSVRCSERANSTQVETAATPLVTDTKRNSKIVSKSKRAEDSSVAVEPPVELLSPIPQEPAVFTQCPECDIPLKILVRIPLSKLTRIPTLLKQTKDTILKQISKSSAAQIAALRIQKKDSSVKADKLQVAKRSQAKESVDKENSNASQKSNKGSAKSSILIKKEKATKVADDSSNKSKSSDASYSSIKVKGKKICDAEEEKIFKKRKNEDGENPGLKKRKLSRLTEERKIKEQVKTEPGSAPDNPGKSKTLERCDSSGSLSSMCSQQSQRSSKPFKDRKKEGSTGGSEPKRIKTCSSPLLSSKDIKQEKDEKPKIRSMDVRIQPEKTKIKSRDKVKETSDVDQFWNDSSQYCQWNEQCKDDTNGKLLGSSQSLDALNRDWDNFAPEMLKVLKAASALNKHNNQAPITPMDYYWTEGKKQRQLAEKEKDPLLQIVKFFEAAVLFILTSQQREECTKDPDAVFRAYSDTLTFSEIFIHSKIKTLQSSPGSTEFKLLILCLKCQSLLNVKLYNLKIKQIKEEIDGVTEFLQHTTTVTTQSSQQSRLTSLSNVPSPHPPSPASNSQSGSYNANGVNVPQGMMDQLCRLHDRLIRLHKAHDLWEQADMYMTRSNLREFFKDVADQSESLTLHSSITELVKYIQKGISLVKKGFR